MKNAIYLKLLNKVENTLTYLQLLPHIGAKKVKVETSLLGR